MPSLRTFVAAASCSFLVVSWLAPVALAQQLEAPPSANEASPPPGPEGDETESDEPRSEPPPSVVPPRILVAPASTFPEQALTAGLSEGAVTVRVTVGVDGKVQEAEVVEPAGHGLDEAAHATALGYVFEPAMRDGQPVAARVLLRIELWAPEAPPTPAAAVVPAPAPAPAEPSRAADTPGSSASGTLSVPAEPVEVTVRGYSEAERLRRSAEAVHVVSTERAKRQTQDLGEVLARTQGVGVQRSAGLGSDTRISLNGLTDDQIRFFLDGVPLDFMGYPFGIANVPVNLVERVEIYRGVVPVRFGADALGGAINLVSDRDIEAGAHAAASFQAGSFGTYRATLNGHHLGERSGWLTRVGAFLDLAENDYPMDKDVPDASGGEVPARVYRFHDAYAALGANLETGLVNQTWAKRLLLRAFVTDYAKEIPHNLIMTYPYGDVELGEFTAGGTLRYEQAFFEQVALSVVAGYAYRTIAYSDVGECVYDWFGQCVRPRPQPGERVGRAQEQDYWEHDVYGRVNVEWLAHPAHALQLSLSPTYTERTGEEHRLPNPDARDPLSAQRQIAGMVTGLEYRLELFESRLENRLFFKDYLQVLRSEEPLSNGADFRRQDRTTHRVGLGDGLRYSFLEWLYAKASYEWATRLPRPDEVFGDAFPVQANLQLKPEVSHNVNLGATVDALETPLGQVRADVNGFARDADELIRLVGDDQSASYQNVYSARALGVESALGWTSPRDYVAIDGNATYVDFRNTSTEGGLAAYEGDRIPNRPYLFATGSLRLCAHDVSAPKDELSLTWTSRYVHSFYLSWESLGSEKLDVSDQLIHSLSLSYFVQGKHAELSFSGEVDNLTDAENFDFFGVPKPGRATYFKVTASL